LVELFLDDIAALLTTLGLGKSFKDALVSLRILQASHYIATLALSSTLWIQLTPQFVDEALFTGCEFGV
jgi:hypothetical protein